MLRFSTRNNCCEFLAFYGVITQSVIQSFLKTLVCGASLSQFDYMLYYMLDNIEVMLNSSKNASSHILATAMGNQATMSSIDLNRVS